MQVNDNLNPSNIIEGGWFKFSKFPQEGRGFQIFPMKREGLLKYVVLLRNGVSFIFTLMSSFFHCGVCISFAHLHDFYQYSLCFPRRTKFYPISIYVTSVSD